MTGKVVGVSDGDTITVLTPDKTQIRVRLYGIDAPESHQDFGTRSKQFASNMVFGKTVTLQIHDTDRYGRTVAEVIIDGRSLNEELVKSGMAWVYPQYCRVSKCIQWNRYEAAARAEKVGLWSHPNPVPPWEFRRTGGKPQREVPKADAPRTTTRETPAVAPRTGSYSGNVNSKIFHHSGCRHFNCKACTAKFSSRDAAIRAGYRPCKVCNP